MRCALSIAVFIASSLSVAAQDLPLGPRSDFGKVVVTNAQSAGGETVTLEQMIGGSFDSEPAYLYPEGSEYRKMGRAVGRLDVLTSKGTAYCTAFVISDRHLMTNGHCFRVKGAQIQTVSFVAGYVETGIIDGTTTYAANPVPLEISEPDDLDFAIVEVFGNPARDWGKLTLSPFAFDNSKHAGWPLVIIGHPAKMAQHVSRKECRASARNPVAGKMLRHTCDTLVGNSGSPVIGDDSRKVVALHKAGDAVNGVNFAVPIALIAERSPIVAGLVDAPKPVVHVDPCEGLLSAAQIGDTCADWTSYLDSCTSHSMAPFVKPHADALCEPDLSVVERMLADPDAYACDAAAGDPLHPDRAAGVMRAEGIDYKDILPDKAIRACEAALRVFPGHPRLLANLAQALHAAGRFFEAHETYQRAARESDPVAQNRLGVMRALGDGVQQSDEMAVAFYRQSADQGYAPAQHHMGVRYAIGNGVAQSDSEAVFWYQKAADLGYAPAQYALGVRYAVGKGIQKSDSLAVSWYLKAAEQGYAEAQHALGVRYATGNGVPKSQDTSISWYLRAAGQGHQDAIDALRRLGIR